MINIYSIWMDPYFYIGIAVFALALFFLVFSMRKYLELKNNADFEETDDDGEEIQGELSLAEAATEDSEPTPVSEEPAAASETSADEGAPAGGSPSRAEEFVKGLYGSLTNLDSRVKNIEKNLAEISKARTDREYPAKFLEDMVADFDTLDKTKIKSRIEFLLGELKK